MTNEEAIKVLLDTAKGFEVKAAVRIIIDAIEKSEKYRWHDLRKNPDDLPENGCEVIYCMIRYGFEIYGMCEFYDGFNCLKNYRKNELKVIDGWRYIAPMEDK